MPDDPQPVDDGHLATADIESLLARAEQAIASIGGRLAGAPPDVRPFQLADFTSTAPNTEQGGLDLPGNAALELDVAIEFGRTQMDLDDVLRLGAGSIVPLDQPAGDPVDIVVNGRLIAKGELLVLNDNFCVRVAELVADEAGK